MNWINGFAESLVSAYDWFNASFSGGVLIALIFFLFIATVAQWSLYEKAGQKGYTCLVPVLNIIVFLRIVGRPANHIWYLLIPGFNFYFLIKVYIELCRSFGKRSWMDYMLVILFNGFYVLHLGLSYEEKYYGPVYNLKKSDGTVSSAQLA